MAKTKEAPEDTSKTGPEERRSTGAATLEEAFAAQEALVAEQNKAIEETAAEDEATAEEVNEAIAEAGAALEAENAAKYGAVEAVEVSDEDAAAAEDA